MSLDLEVQVVVVDLEGHREDATAQVFVLEEDGEALAKFFQARSVCALSLLSQVDVDEFVDVCAVDIHKLLAHK